MFMGKNLDGKDSRCFVKTKGVCSNIFMRNRNSQDDCKKLSREFTEFKARVGSNMLRQNQNSQDNCRESSGEWTEFSAFISVKYLIFLMDGSKNKRPVFKPNKTKRNKPFTTHWLA